MLMTFKGEEVKKRTRLHLRKNQSRSYQKVASLSTSGTATLGILTRGDQACEEETYGKSLVGNKGSSETKILGTQWDKKGDTLTVDFRTCLKDLKPLTKRKMISAINSIYDVLGWSSPVTIIAKLIFSEVCHHKLHWDEEVPNDIQRKWEAWVTSLQKAPTLTVPRCVFKASRHPF